jgi:hypothetical protein
MGFWISSGNSLTNFYFYMETYSSLNLIVGLVIFFCQGKIRILFSYFQQFIDYSFLMKLLNLFVLRKFFKIFLFLQDQNLID